MVGLDNIFVSSKNRRKIGEGKGAWASPINVAFRYEFWYP